MNKKHFTKEEVFDLLDCEMEEDEIDLVVFQESKPFKHGTLEYYVIKYQGSYWKFVFQAHYENGWQINSGVDAVEVRPQEKVITEWIEIE